MKEYATHDYDAVLDLYYAKARFYDAYNRTFTAQDPILDPSQYDLREYVKEPMALVQYLYVTDNAINYIDILGLLKINGHEVYGAISGADVTGKANDETIYVNLGDFQGLMYTYGYVEESSKSHTSTVNINGTFSKTYRNAKTGKQINVSLSTRRVNAPTSLYFCASNNRFFYC